MASAPASGLPPAAVLPGSLCVALAGNPNAGKTTVFNALTGLRAKTANFPGTTIEHRSARVTLGGRAVELIDLPGLYSLDAATHEERVARDVLGGAAHGVRRPDAVILVIDATNLERNLFLAAQVLELGLPVVAALTMVDLAEKAGVRIDVQALEEELGCPVVRVTARTGRGLDDLRRSVESTLGVEPSPPACAVKCAGCGLAARFEWAENVGARVAPSRVLPGPRAEAIDRVLTHGVVGVVAFFGVMFSVFAMIFWLARYPMDAIELLFATLGAWVGDAASAVAASMPAGAMATFVGDDLRSLLVDGVVGGVGGVLVFLPQIAILFFFLSILEDSGYLARAAFVMDRLMRRVGLPGKAFVPMLSAHACAVPAIMSTRVIEDRRDRLATILVLPLLTCSARIPIFAMVVALLFPHAPLAASGMFTLAYVLGIIAAMATALAFKRSLLRGEPRPLVLELPTYRVPSLRNAFLAMLDRALIFVRKAGTVILVVSIGLWALAHYPKSVPPPGTEEPRAVAQHELSHSYAGKIGHVIEPAIRPLGFDWQIGIGILSSFAAREVFVSTLAIVYGAGAGAADEDPQRLYDRLATATRSDGTRVFTAATCVAVLLFYVFAMQCMSTLAITRRETGNWRWPALQFGYMTLLAYGLAFVAFQGLSALGFN